MTGKIINPDGTVSILSGAAGGPQSLGVRPVEGTYAAGVNANSVSPLCELARVTDLAIGGEEFTTCATLTGKFLVLFARLTPVTNTAGEVELIIDDVVYNLTTPIGTTFTIIGDTANNQALPPITVNESMTIKARQPAGSATNTVLTIVGYKIGSV